MTSSVSATDFWLIPIARAGQPDEAGLDLGPDLLHMCHATRTLYESVGYVPPWISYLALSESKVVGGGAFVGAPKDGRVELAYFTLPGFEHRGHAKRTAYALVSIARDADPGLTLWAKTMPQRGPSTTILATLGFVRSGTVVDHEIGVAWCWELSPATDQGRREPRQKGVWGAH